MLANQENSVVCDSINQAFLEGNFHLVAREAEAGDWRKYAAFGLIGRGRQAIDCLQEFEDKNARFYLGVSHWIHGDEEEAIKCLTQVDSDHARNLIHLIAQPTIQVAAQTTWDEVSFQDDKFNLIPIGIPHHVINSKGKKLANTTPPAQPFYSLMKEFGPRSYPDFYFAHMAEWHYLPMDLAEAPFPTFATTEDVDIHIQLLRHSLPSFDALITTGFKQWELAIKNSGRPAFTFPKLFGIAENMPEFAPSRHKDLFISGGFNYPYHPEKILIIRSLLESSLRGIDYNNGFLSPEDYYQRLGEAKTCFTFCRYPGAMPSRGLEALAMGCGVATEANSGMTLYFDETDGVFTYDDQTRSLPETLLHIINHWDQVESHAKLGAEKVRREFALSRCTSQFLRFLTVLAARPQHSKTQASPAKNHKRHVRTKGWAFSPQINLYQIDNHMKQAARNTPKTLSTYIDGARECSLFLSHEKSLFTEVCQEACLPEALIKQTVSVVENVTKNCRQIFSDGMKAHPKALVLSFNAIRFAFHSGEPKDIPRTLQFAEQLLKHSAEHWEVAADDDVMPFDYFESHFNYRDYFDAITEGDPESPEAASKLIHLILASIHHYVGCYTNNLAHLEKAAELDPRFAFYQYHLALHLSNSGQDDQLRRVIGILEHLSKDSILYETAGIKLFELTRRHSVSSDRLKDWKSEFGKLRRCYNESLWCNIMAPEKELILPLGVDQLTLFSPLPHTQPPPITDEIDPIDAMLQLAIHPLPKAGKILLIPFECAHWNDARQWSYNGFYSIRAALRAQGIKVTTLPAIAGVSSNHPASFLFEGNREKICKGENYDQVWIWITHNDYDPELLHWLASIAPVRVGVVMESLEHSVEEEAHFQHLVARRKKALGHLKHCTHVLTFDEKDAETLPKDLPLKAQWCPPVVGWRDVCDEIKLPAVATAAFQGTLYSHERLAFCECPELKSLLSHPDLPEISTQWPKQFDTIQQNCVTMLASKKWSVSLWFQTYISQLCTIRRQLNDLWQKGLHQSYAQVNLPSIFKSYAGRVVESMAAGRPVISWKPPRERTQALFTPGKEILWFDRDKPEQLAEQIRWLQANPEQAKEIAENAQRKVLRYHTAEIRVRQILDWIEYGTEPDYGENTDLSTETKQPEIVMNTNTLPQPETLEAALNQAEACSECEDRAGAIQALEQALELGDRHPVLLRALATQQFLMAQHREARALFQEFTTVCPNDATGHVQHGLAAFHDGDEEACTAALQQALILEPNHPEALKLLADLDVLAERYVEARSKYDQVAELGGITAEALQALAFCQYKTGEMERAQNTYKQLLAFDPENELTNHNLNVIETTLRENLPAPAKADPKMETTPVNEFLEQADFFQQAGNTVAALAELERALELDPKNPRLIEALGSGLFQQERFEEARRQFRHLIELQPCNALAYTRLAMTSYVTDRYDEFESALGLAMEIDPELPEMLHFMGKINLDQERHYDAGRIFSKLVELEPNNVQNLLALAMCLYQGDQSEAAKDTYERALQMDPENKIAWANLMEIEKDASSTEPENETQETEPNPEPLNALLQKAQAALEQGEPQRAIAILENVLTQNPAEVALLTALGNLYFSEGQLDEALEYFRRNSDLQPKDVVVQLQTATTALLAEDYEIFETYMERALELEPENPHGLKLLATANFRAQKYKEAAELYRQALPGLPEDIEIVLAMGVCFHKLGDLPTAESCFKRALEVDPYNTVASENLKALTNVAAQPETEIQSNGHISAAVLKDIRNQAQAKAGDDPENLPTAALVGNLDHAQDLLGQGLHIESWQETLKAIEQRPFHPEAYLHLAEIALEAGDAQQAAKCLEALNALTPSWEIPQQALEAIRQQSPVQSSEIDWAALPENTTDPRLSVCLIVKDEEQFLGDALQSVKAIAQQIIVVDTGSTDRTVEIAEEHGAEVLHFEWCDDFSAARNVALEHARGNWVLVLDADEILPADEIEHLRADLARANYLGYRLPLVNIIQTDQGEDETADGLCYVPRLFRNAPGLHFVGRVHEQIYSSVLVRQIDWQMDSGIGTTCLHHFGYTPEVKIERDKVKRNLKLLEMAMDEQPAEPSMLMNYALDLFNDGQLEAALEKDQQAFALLSKHTREDVLPEVRERLVSVYCYHLLQAELYEELVEIATSPLAIDCGPTASIEYVHGLALLKLERFEEAIEPFRKCITKRDEPAFTARFKGVEGHGPHHLLADCLAKTGQEEAATAEYEQALDMAPEATSVRHGYAHYLTELEQPEKAVKLLFDAIENGSIDARLWSLGCHIVNGHLNDSEVALHWTDCAIDEFPEHPEIRKQRGIALLTVGNFRDALVFFEMTPQHPLNEGARILCHIAVGQATQLSDPDKEQLISTAFMEWFRRLLERGQNESANRLVKNIDALETILPTAAGALHEAVSTEK